MLTKSPEGLKSVSSEQSRNDPLDKPLLSHSQDGTTAASQASQESGASAA